MYTIGQVAEMFGLPVSTLRYYDKQGLFPGLERASGIRRFGDTELEALRVIECLKKAGMEIKDIRLFINTIDHAVDAMKTAGIQAKAEKTETEDYIECTVRIPKSHRVQV